MRFPAIRFLRTNKDIAAVFLICAALFSCGQASPIPGMAPVFFFLAATGGTATYDASTNTNSGTLTNGNLTYAATSGSGNVVRSTHFQSSGKYYWEITYNTIGQAGYTALGVIQQSQSTVTPTNCGAVPAGMWLWRDDALKFNNGSCPSYGSSASTGSVLSNALDAGGGFIWWGLCSGGTITWFGSGNPAGGTNPSFSGLTGNLGAVVDYFGHPATLQITANFGATGYNCTPPTGFNNNL